MSELTFDGQREGEKVKLIFRRHITTVRKGLQFLIVMIILGIIPLVLWPDIPQMFWIFIGAVVIGLLGLGYSYMLWYFSVYIVTNERIRQITQRGLFKKTVVDLSIDKIQSVSVSTPNIIAGIFGYGTILIQTGVGDLIISQVPKPNDIHNKLQNIAKEAGV
ncbi:PH domain-containing protein [Candidatus Saccharibacteria bacterium]|nr:PH domain-containing protein [Candidatus Saccharibacteria bacterium]